jgi:hypothetical protein
VIICEKSEKIKKLKLQLRFLMSRAIPRQKFWLPERESWQRGLLKKERKATFLYTKTIN